MKHNIVKEDNNLSKFKEVKSKSIERLKEIWRFGEGDLTVEIRNDTGEKKAKIRSSRVERI